MVYKGFLHFVRDELAHNALKVSWVSPLNEEVELVAEIFAEIKVFGLFVECVPLLNKRQLCPFRVVTVDSHDFSDLGLDLTDLRKVVNQHNFRTRNVFYEIALTAIETLMKTRFCQPLVLIERLLETQIPLGWLGSLLQILCCLHD